MKMQRAAVIVLYLIATLQVAADSCITVSLSGFDFFRGSESVFFARAERTPGGSSLLRADQIIRGPRALGDTVSVPRQPCVFVAEGRRYLVAEWKCETEPVMCLTFVEESRSDEKLRYLANAHAETHETVMAAFLRWYRFEITFETFNEWLDTVSIQARSDTEDKFLAEVVSDLGEVFRGLEFFSRHIDIDDYARTALRDVAQQMEKFPPGLAEEFDARVAKEEDALLRSDLESELRWAIRAVRESDEWRERGDEAYAIAIRTKSTNH